jgi:hypothetical protein
MEPNSLKRLIVTGLSAVAIILNQKFGLNLGDAEIAALAAIIVTFLAGSNLRAMADKKAEVAAAAIDSTEKAAAVLGGEVKK